MHFLVSQDPSLNFFLIHNDLLIFGYHILVVPP